MKRTIAHAGMIMISILLLGSTGFAATAAERAEIPRFEPGLGISEPMAMELVHPTFTEEALAAGVRGAMVLDLVIGADGAVVEAKPLRNLAHGMTERTVEAVSAWRFKPATRDGKPLAVRYKMALRVAPRR